MENEQRLIDGNKAQAVLANMAEHLLEAGNPEMAGAVGYAAEVISKQHTVDAVEVVRCKDCKQWIRNGGIAESPNGHCFYHDIDTNGYDFCSYGERREGE